MRIKNDTNSDAFFYYVGTDHSIAVPLRVHCGTAGVELPYERGTALTIFWVNGRDERNHMLHASQPWADGTYTVYEKVHSRGVRGPPLLAFDPVDDVVDDGAYTDEQYRIVARSVAQLACSHCYKTDCSCLRTDDAVERNLSCLIRHGIVSQRQLHGIIQTLGVDKIPP